MQLLCCIFFLWLQFCALLVELMLAQNPELILVLVQKRALETLECVLSTLNKLLQIEIEKRQIQGVCNPPTEFVKMCFNVFWKA